MSHLHPFNKPHVLEERQEDMRRAGRSMRLRGEEKMPYVFSVY